MAVEIENIGRKDVLWGLAATIVTVGAGVIFLPFILYKMSAETVGLWNVFLTVSSLVTLLDFGFLPSFARNVSYIFSGAKNLQKEGVEVLHNEQDVDYGLLKTTIVAMQKFYRWMALAIFLLLASCGSAYMLMLLRKYNGDQTDALVAWIMLVFVSCYNLYTMYYEALLTGKGYIKRMYQINILGQSCYIIVGVLLIYFDFGLTAIVTSQLISIVIRRTLYKKVFLTKQMRESLSAAQEHDIKPVLQAIVPNATKMGLTNLGGFLITRSAIFIGSAVLPLTDMAAYGVTFQVLIILARCASIVYTSYIPKMAQYRVQNDIANLRKIYVHSVLFLTAVFLLGSVALFCFGDWAINFIKSDTHFLSFNMTLVLIITQFLEANHIIASGFILSDNKIPFFIPSLLSAAATLVLMIIFLYCTPLGLWSLILAPGIAQLAYQNWKWPAVVIKELYADNKTNTIQ